MAPRVGLVARADDTGLGTQSREFAHHMKPSKTMIVDLCGVSSSGKDLTLHPEWFDNYHVIKGIPTITDIQEFLEDLDVVFTMETPYNYGLFEQARSYGVRSVLQYNWEFLHYLQPGPWLNQIPDVLASPSTWHLDEAKQKFSGVAEVVHLPVPIARHRFPQIRTPRASDHLRVLHVVGHEAIHDRNGTQDLLDALRYVESDVEVTIRTQAKNIGALVNVLGETASGVKVHITGGEENYWDLYADQDILVLPRRYGGLCLPINEALAAGMPVITTDISPNHDWLPQDWLVPTSLRDWFTARSVIEIHSTHPKALAAKIDQFSDWQTYNDARYDASVLAGTYGWNILKPRYEEVCG